MSTTPQQVMTSALYDEVLGGTDEAGDDTYLMIGGQASDIANRLLAALRDAGYAVVELPKLGPTDEIRAVDGMVVDAGAIDAGGWRSPEEARSDAAALLAAADAAERGES